MSNLHHSSYLGMTTRRVWDGTPLSHPCPKIYSYFSSLSQTRGRAGNAPPSLFWNNSWNPNPAPSRHGYVFSGRGEWSEVGLCRARLQVGNSGKNQSPFWEAPKPQLHQNHHLARTTKKFVTNSDSQSWIALLKGRDCNKISHLLPRNWQRKCPNFAYIFPKYVKSMRITTPIPLILHYYLRKIIRDSNKLQGCMPYNQNQTIKRFK